MKNMRNKTVKNVAKDLGEGLGVAAMIGLTFLSAYAEANADEDAKRKFVVLDNEFNELKRDIFNIPLAKYPYGYYNGIISDFNRIRDMNDNIRRLILTYGLTSKSIKEIEVRYGYAYLTRFENEMYALRHRIKFYVSTFKKYSEEIYPHYIFLFF